MSDNPATNLTPEELGRMRHTLRVLSYWDADDKPRQTALEDYVLRVMPQDDEERLSGLLDFNPDLRQRVESLAANLAEEGSPSLAALGQAIEHLRELVAKSRMLARTSRGDGSTPGGQLEEQFSRLESIESPTDSDVRDLRYLLEEALRRVKRLERHNEQLYDALDAVFEAHQPSGKRT